MMTDEELGVVERVFDNPNIRAAVVTLRAHGWNPMICPGDASLVGFSEGEDIIDASDLPIILRPFGRQIEAFIKRENW